MLSTNTNKEINMPVILDDVQKNIAATTKKNAVKSYKAKFFSDVLTGSGKKTGLLSEAANPSALAATKNGTVTSANIQTLKKRTVSGNVTTNYIPLNPLDADAWEQMKIHKRPELADMVCIAKHPTTNESVYLDMPVHSIIAQETETKTGSKIRKINPCYQLFLYTIRDINDVNHEMVRTAVSKANGNSYFFDFTVSPLRFLQSIANDLTNAGYSVDAQTMNDYITNYVLYNAVAKRSEEWQTKIDTIIDEYLDNMVKSTVYGANSKIKNTIKRLETYNVPLDLYRNIYSSLQKHFKPDDVASLCKHNLNLLLSDTLNSLNNNKPQLQHIPTPNPSVALPSNVAKWSSEQKIAVTTPEPLVLVQAGAGTGKRTVILGRLSYMQACGVDPDDITILSFTNAAADHITELDANVHSMTIAKMVHSIYSENYPTHELSSEKTLMNCIDIYFANNNTASRFKYLLGDVERNEANAYTDLNNFVEDNFDEVINILNVTRQTTLTLEIIICYQKIDILTEPAEIKSKYLIVDEVQDNSIFEFIYTLKYVDKHNESLFIVGDCSQTLYEFRGSNPRGLNVLESSGVFATYQLQTNYRSNQEILDFANKHLLNIEANQQANLQLKANSLAKVTEKTFRQKVNLSYHCLQKVGDFSINIGPNFAVYCKNYIDSCLARGEQIAVLAYKRKDIYCIEEAIKKLYPTATINNLIPKRQYDSAIFSAFIKNYWNEVQFIPTKSIEIVICQAIIGKVDFLMRGDHNKNLAIIQKSVGGWRTQNAGIIQSWQTQYTHGLMNQDEFFENLKQSLLDYEIRTNSIRQSLLAAQNEEAKKNADPNANFVLSTIHSAKGLEFDNCIVIHRNDNNMDEDQKRMYYVAFTRAKNTELILSYDTVKSPQIETNYKLICQQLHEQDITLAKTMGKTHNIIANNVSTEVIDDDFYNADGTYATIVANTNATPLAPTGTED
jgi:DNA helicase-2/ATP-dependent DNA helicase PcrA